MTVLLTYLEYLLNLVFIINPSESHKESFQMNPLDVLYPPPSYLDLTALKLPSISEENGDEEGNKARCFSALDR